MSLELLEVKAGSGFAVQQATHFFRKELQLPIPDSAIEAAVMDNPRSARDAVIRLLLHMPPPPFEVKQAPNGIERRIACLPVIGSNSIATSIQRIDMYQSPIGTALEVMYPDRVVPFIFTPDGNYSKEFLIQGARRLKGTSLYIFHVYPQKIMVA